MLSASFNDDKIAWYENLGAGTFGGQQVISSVSDGAISVFAGDLDGDGDLDVMSASFDDDVIGWHENRNFSDPLDPDSDDDGLLDGVETNTGVFVDANDTGSDPLVADTDGDGVDDYLEVLNGSDPNDPLDTPQFILPLLAPATLVLLALLLGVAGRSRIRRGLEVGATARPDRRDIRSPGTARPPRDGGRA